jgi:hypothetical protein
MIPYSPEYFAARDAALRIATAGFEGLDEMEPKLPCGHSYGLHKSAMLTTDYRVRLRRGIVDVTPQEVIDCMIQANIKNWCLMGLHGYVGYLPMPRATQDVDVMVPYSQRKRAADAVGARWPMLTRVELPQVIRFMDSTDLDPDGHAKPVVDIMNPWSPFQETILKQHVLTDEKTGSRYPTVEAALASKYAALVSPNRSRDKKEQVAVDFRKITRASHHLVKRDLLHSLGNQIWEKGGDEVLKFIELTLTDQALPI